MVLCCQTLFLTTIVAHVLPGLNTFFKKKSIRILTLSGGGRVKIRIKYNKLIPTKNSLFLALKVKNQTSLVYLFKYYDICGNFLNSIL